MCSSDLGAQVGSDMAETGSEGIGWDNIAGGVGGAFFGANMRHMGPIAKKMGGRAVAGNWSAGAAGEVGQMSGAMTPEQAERLRQAGSLGGFVSPLVKGFKPGAVGNTGKKIGGISENLGTKAWTQTPLQTVKDIAGKGAKMSKTQRAALAAGALPPTVLASSVASNISGMVGGPTIEGMTESVKTYASELVGTGVDKFLETDQGKATITGSLSRHWKSLAVRTPLRARLLRRRRPASSVTSWA